MNTPPKITIADGGSIAASGRAGTMNLTVSDRLQTPTSSLTLRAASSSTTLVPVKNVVFAGSGSNRTVTATAPPEPPERLSSPSPRPATR
ncbi:MAG TPA: hypothetical protein VIU11_22950 [Nakamurella sp.]